MRFGLPVLHLQQHSDYGLCPDGDCRTTLRDRLELSACLVETAPRRVELTEQGVGVKLRGIDFNDLPKAAFGGGYVTEHDRHPSRKQQQPRIVGGRCEPSVDTRPRSVRRLRLEIQGRQA